MAESVACDRSIYVVSVWYYHFIRVIYLILILILSLSSYCKYEIGCAIIRIISTAVLYSTVPEFVCSCKGPTVLATTSTYGIRVVQRITGTARSSIYIVGSYRIVVVSSRQSTTVDTYRYQVQLHASTQYCIIQ